jgi:hypothetical protein
MGSSTEVLSHWSTLIENFQFSPQQFYSIATEAVKKRQIPDLSISSSNFKEGNLLSANRQYLTMWYKREFYYAICAGLYGTGFFVSSWLLQPPDGCLVALFEPFPILSGIARALVKPWTYYRIDTVTMFRTAVHAAVTEAVDTITASAQGVRQLSDADKKPINRDFLQ